MLIIHINRWSAMPDPFDSLYAYDTLFLQSLLNHNSNIVAAIPLQVQTVYIHQYNGPFPWYTLLSKARLCLAA